MEAASLARQPSKDPYAKLTHTLIELAERNEAKTVKQASVHFPGLDGLRGIAILAVMLNHYGPPFVFTGHSFWERTLAAVCIHGYLGVDLFFALSGFLITGILIDSRGAPNYLPRFYWRRSLRIFPVYFFYLFLIFGVIGTLFPHELEGVGPKWL